MRCRLGGAEGPLIERQIACQQRAAPLVTLAEHLEEQRALKRALA